MPLTYRRRNWRRPRRNWIPTVPAGGVQYSELSRSFTVLATFGETETTTRGELGRAFTVLATFGEAETAQRGEPAKALPLLAAFGETNSAAWLDTGKALGVVVGGIGSDTGAFIDTHSLSLLAAFGETDARAQVEEGLGFPLLAGTVGAEALILGELVRAAGLLAGLGEADTAAFVDALALTVLAVPGSVDSRHGTESGLAQLLLGGFWETEQVGRGELLRAVSLLVGVTGTSTAAFVDDAALALLAGLGSTEGLHFPEAGLGVPLLAAFGESEAATRAEILGQIFPASLGATDTAAFVDDASLLLLALFGATLGFVEERGADLLAVLGSGELWTGQEAQGTQALTALACTDGLIITQIRAALLRASLGETDTAEFQQLARALSLSARLGASDGRALPETGKALALLAALGQAALWSGRETRGTEGAVEAAGSDAFQALDTHGLTLRSLETALTALAGQETAHQFLLALLGHRERAAIAAQPLTRGRRQGEAVGGQRGVALVSGAATEANLHGEQTPSLSTGSRAGDRVRGQRKAPLLGGERTDADD